MIKIKNAGILNKIKIISLQDPLRARTFCARRKSISARSAYAYERARNYLRLGMVKMDATNLVFRL